RGLEPRLPAIKVGNVAEFAQIGAAAGELQSQHEIVLQRDQVVGRDREIVQRNAVLGFQAQLRARARDTLVEAGDELIGRVTELADVKVVDLGIHFRRGRRGRSAQQ